MEISRTVTWAHDAKSLPGETSKLAENWLAIGLYKTDQLLATPNGMDQLKPILEFLPPSGEAPTGIGETLAVYPPANLNLPALLFYGLGDPAKQSPATANDAAIAASKKLAGKSGRSVVVLIPDQIDAQALVKGWIIGTRGPGLKKKEPSRFEFASLRFWDPLEKIKTDQFNKATKVAKYINLARELGNTTPEDKCPERLAEKAALIAAAAGCQVEVWDESKIRDERFGGLMGVAAGSSRPPRFVVIHHKGQPNNSDHYAIVGKGVTFDSGGLSLKPSNSMEDMKNDMTGAAVALATVTLLAELKAKVNVTAYLPMTENMTGGLATKLGDVLTMRDGTTVEILNTDAEGRLILADALAYANEKKPAAIVDLATLTGACVVALGTKIAGLFSNNEILAGKLVESSRLNGERLWQLPIDDDFKEQLKSQVADLKNVGSRWGGAITAAKFLQHFIGETPWAHLDIAGPSWSDSDSSTRDAGGTGCYVATLADWLLLNQDD